MFDPIQASQEIKDVFINYITTSLEIADTEFSELLKQALEQEDEITKGPFPKAHFWTLADPMKQDGRCGI